MDYGFVHVPLQRLQILLKADFCEGEPFLAFVRIAWFRAITMRM